MQLAVTGKNIDVTAAQFRQSKRLRGGAPAATDAIRGYVADKLGRVQRHLGEVRDAHVVLSVEKHRGPVSPIKKVTRRRASGDRHFAEVNLNANGTTLHADAEDEDMYAAIDAMADKIDRQARRHHGEATDHTAPRTGDIAGQPPGSSE